MSYVVVLATIMAIAAIIGYLLGARFAVLTAAVIWGGLLLVSRAGGSIANLINGSYYAVRFVLVGGIQTLGSAADRTAMMASVTQRLRNVEPLVSGDSAGTEFLVVFGGLILLAVIAGLGARLRGPQSKLGFPIGLANGYLVGAALLNAIMPSLDLALPFGLTSRMATGQMAGAVQNSGRLSTPNAGQLAQQLATWADNLNQRTLAWIVMIAIAAFVVGAIRLGQRGKRAD